jgi:hypothetical protein
MAITAQCVCGEVVRLTSDTANESDPANEGEYSLTATTTCPACGRAVSTNDELPPPLLGDSMSTGAIPQAATPPFAPPPLPPASSASSGADGVPLFLRLLLDPNTIRRLLMVGGGVSVLGLIAWLVSLGLFDDPRVLAVAMGAGNLTLLAAGWGVSLRTKHKLAGQALTFLGCVFAPLNLWFYDAQNLLTVDGHLWVGGVVCSLLYIATVRVLRDPLYLYAVEAGITLTALLLLGDLGRATDSSTLCVVLTALAAASIHAYSAFAAEHPEFNRRRYGLPLFFSGQVQLGLAMLGLLFLQMLNWVAPGGPQGSWGDSQIATTPWLAGGLWLTAAYLWLYSDLAVRKLGVYSYLAAIALLLAETTWLYPLLPTEGLMIGLSLTGLAIRALIGQTIPDRKLWSGFAGKVGLIVAAIPCVIGFSRHVQFPWTEATAATSLLFGVTWLILAGSTWAQGLLQNRDHATENPQTEGTLGTYWMFAALSAWLGVTYLAIACGLDAYKWHAPLALLMPVAGTLLTPRFRLGLGRPLAAAMVVTLIVGPLFSLTTIRTPGEFERLVTSAGDALFAALILFEVSVTFLASGLVNERRLGTRLVGGLFFLMSVAKFFQWADLPEEAYGPAVAAFGVTLIGIGRLFPRGGDLKTLKGEVWNPVVSAGDLALLIGELVVFLQTLGQVLRPVLNTDAADVIAAVLTTVLAMVGGLLAPAGAVRTWHRFAAMCLVAATAVLGIRALDLNDNQKIELAIEVFGIALVAAGYAGRLKEKQGERDPGTSLALWVGSLGAVLPVLAFTLGHRLFGRDASFGDELALVTISLALVVTGCVLQVRSTTTLGAGAFVLYLMVLFGQLVYRPQVALGAYLAIGGGLVFLAGVVLSIYRDRLLALPGKIANREGVFRIIDWR